MVAGCVDVCVCVCMYVSLYEYIFFFLQHHGRKSKIGNMVLIAVKINIKKLKHLLTDTISISC